jgi:hypothetical protein
MKLPSVRAVEMNPSQDELAISQCPSSAGNCDHTGLIPVP